MHRLVRSARARASKTAKGAAPAKTLCALVAIGYAHFVQFGVGRRSSLMRWSERDTDPTRPFAGVVPGRTRPARAVSAEEYAARSIISRPVLAPIHPRTSVTAKWPARRRAGPAPLAVRRSYREIGLLPSATPLYWRSQSTAAVGFDDGRGQCSAELRPPTVTWG